MSLRDAYETRKPSIQNIFDRFKDNFLTSFPDIVTSPGNYNAPADSRIIWSNSKLNLKDKKILECGPLELGHSYAMNKYGCKSITTIENNWFCYLKCLAVKDAFKLNNVDLLFGDVVEYLKNEQNLHFDFVLCSGLLYHLQNPVELIHLFSKITDNIFIWTHVYDKHSSSLKVQNIIDSEIIYDGEKYSGGKQKYHDEGKSSIESVYCGGKFEISFWIDENCLYKALNKYGFTNIEKNEDLSDLNHVNGPCISIFASKTI